MAEKRSFSKAVSQGKTGKQPSIVETKQSSGAQPKLPNLAQPGAAPNLRADADMASPTRTKDKDQDRYNDGLDSQAPTPTQEPPGPTPQPKRHLASTGSALLPMDTSPVASSDLGMKETIVMAATEPADPPSTVTRPGSACRIRRARATPTGECATAMPHMQHPMHASICMKHMTSTAA